MNIVVLMAGRDRLKNEDEYPVFLVEHHERPLIEHITESLCEIPGARLIFVAREEDVQRYRVDNIISLLAPGSAVVSCEGETQGAACSALLAVKHINNQEPLLVCGVDDLVTVPYRAIVEFFREQAWDAGSVVFSSVHPRYSFVRLDDNGLVVEAAEKRPLSRNANAGIYYFARGADFVEAVQAMIRKDAQVNGNFYIAPAFNEMILRQARIGVYSIAPSQYHPVKSASQLRAYESFVETETRHEAR